MYTNTKRVATIAALGATAMGLISMSYWQYSGMVPPLLVFSVIFTTGATTILIWQRLRR